MRSKNHHSLFPRRLAATLLALTIAGTGALAQEATPPAEAAPEAAAPVEAAPPPPCGTKPITMARLQWPSAALLAAIHADVLKTAFNCDVRLQEGDMATIGASMGGTGQPAVAPEMWISRISEIWNAAIKAQEVRQAGTSYAEQVFEGWFVPAYAAERWPEITTIEGLKARAAEMGGRAKPKFLSCPLDWGCNIVNRNMLRANGLDQVFDVIEPANRFELDTLIAEAVGRNEAIVFYYWQPNAVLSQFAFREIALAAYNKDNFLCMGRTACAAPLPTGFAPDPVITALAEWVYVDAPQVAAYFQRAKMPFAEMNTMLQQLTEPGATVESIAARFIAEKGEVWRPWAGLSATAPEGAAADAPAQDAAPAKRQPASNPAPEPPAATPPAEPPQSLT
ncbi:MAG TPA: glycine betaine ABC transporter substrate-binding protein [Devosia sp.]|nr:glycine betaine ABC transporter substrate-binding protein [Devosia sp.]